MLQKLSLNGFRRVVNTYQFNEDFTKDCNEGSDVGYLFKVYDQYSEELHNFHDELLFLLE